MSFFEFKNIYKSFNNYLLLDDVTYSFPNTGFVALIGNSGAGKTTLFYILLGLEKKDKGSIIYDDKELVTEKDFLSLRKDTYFVFQEYGVLNYLNGLDNLNLGGYQFNYENNFLNKEYLKKEAKFLSGGEKQRLALLKAIKIKPKIIFCDEPTGALDEENGKLIMQELKELSSYCLVIMISHNIKLVDEYADIVLSIKNKKIVVKKNNIEIFKKENRAKTFKQNSIMSVKIAIKIFFKEKLKLLLTFICITLTFCSLLILSNLNNFSSYTLDNVATSFFDYNRLKVSYIEENNIDNTSFTISKITRPSKNFLKKILLDECDIEYNLDYFIQGASIKYNCKNISINILTYPFSGGIEDFRINKAAKSIINSFDIPIEININKKISTNYNNKIINDEANLFISGYVNKVYDEFDFFNTPCLFISHDALKDYMKGTKLIKLSKERNVFTSLYDRFGALSLDDESYSSYSYYVDVKEIKKVNKVFKKLKSFKELDVENRAFIVKNTLSSSFELINMIISIFSILSFIITLILLYHFMLNSFQKRKKEFVLYKTFGFSNFKILILQFIPILLFLVLCYLFAFFPYKVCCNVLNILIFPYLKCYIFANMLLPISSSIFYLILIFISSFILSIIFVYLIKRIKVSEVIKSE